MESDRRQVTFSIGDESFTFARYGSKAAVCVKFHGSSPEPKTPEHIRYWQSLTDTQRYRLIDDVHDIVSQSWWDSTHEYARETGLVVGRDGRSGGWLILEDLDKLETHEYEGGRECEHRTSVYDPEEGKTRAYCGLPPDAHYPTKLPYQLHLFETFASICEHCQDYLSAHSAGKCGLFHIGREYSPHRYESSGLDALRSYAALADWVEKRCDTKELEAELQFVFEYTLDDRIADDGWTSSEPPEEG